MSRYRKAELKRQQATIPAVSDNLFSSPHLARTHTRSDGDVTNLNLRQKMAIACLPNTGSSPRLPMLIHPMTTHADLFRTISVASAKISNTHVEGYDSAVGSSSSCDVLNDM